MPDAGVRICSALEQSRARRKKSLNVAKWGREATLVPFSRGTPGLLFSQTSLVPRENRSDFSHLIERANLNDCFGLSNVLRRTCFVLSPPLYRITYCEARDETNDFLV